MIQINPNVADWKTSIKGYSSCPVCGENKFHMRHLKNGKLGFWCDNCLSGIPSFGYPARYTIEETLLSYSNFVNDRIHQKFLNYWEK